ncbi:MAG: hypothetical protein ACPG7F_06290 [Aggregatilineales bacterium]
MPDKLKNNTGTGEMSRIQADDIRYRQETMALTHLPEHISDAGASTGLMPVIHETEDDDALREMDSPDTHSSR